MKRWLLLSILLLSLSGVARAAIDTYQFANDQMRERFHLLTLQLRCPKCQNQDIADSNAPIASDLRREIHRLLTEGKDDGQIIEFMVDRYGEFVRYKPALTARTGLLWFGPAVLLVVGVGVIALTLRRRRRQPATSPRDLDPAERARLAALLAQKPLDEDRP
ncbi:cytochrome c-type biogenesis protein [Pseudomonas coleopterorum]|uniref:Cytochrome c-type biogenesis protein n=1 Tax=Pseudomonas coleopterorum TaxID=1605838 RepID=A0AAJ6MV78_9PSED|nr:cytochrome c-type biogenesis protein [Pseudomonas coleopterorum]WNC11440.1 cytochrome c-type biogenesis protein [Pseudomonas coleopterorum]